MNVDKFIGLFFHLHHMLKSSANFEGKHISFIY